MPPPKFNPRKSKQRRRFTGIEKLENRNLLSVSPISSANLADNEASALVIDNDSTTSLVSVSSNNSVQIDGPSEIRTRDTYVLTILESPANASLWNVDWGDGRDDEFETPTSTLLHSYATPGAYTIKTQVFDTNGRSIAEDTIEVAISAGSPAVIDRAQEGLFAELFDESDSDAVAAESRIDPAINFDFGNGVAAPSLTDDEQFTVRWTGTITPDFTATHTFHTTTGLSDQIRLIVDGNVLIDTFNSPNNSVNSADLALIESDAAELVVEYSAGKGASKAILEWENPFWFREPIPASNLTPTSHTMPTGFTLDRWAEIAEPSLSKLAENLDFQQNSPQSSSIVQSENWLIPDDASQLPGTFSGNRGRAIVSAPETGLYRFYLSASGEAEVFINANVQSNNLTTLAQASATAPLEFERSASQESAEVYLRSGQEFYLEVLQAISNSDTNHLAIAWLTPSSSAVELIPGSTIRPILPSVKLHAEVSQTNEADGYSSGLRYAVSRTDKLGDDLDVYYTLGGETVNGIDYETLSGTITIPAGEATAYITVDPIDDGVFEGTESISIRLLGSNDYWLGKESEIQTLGFINGEIPSSIIAVLPDEAVSLTNVSFTVGDSNGNGNFTNVTLSESIPGSNANQALAIEVADFNNVWDVRPVWIVDSDIEAGETITISLYARSTNTDASNAVLTTRYELSTAPYTGKQNTFSVTNQWTKLQSTFVADQDYQANEWIVDVRAAHAIQNLEIADLQVDVLKNRLNALPNDALALSNIDIVGGDAEFTNVSLSEPIRGSSATEALRVTVNSFTNVYDVRPIWVADQNASAGDTLLISLFARSLNSNGEDAVLTARYEQNTGSFQGDEETIDFGTQWTQLLFPLQIEQDLLPNEWNIDIRLGHAIQSVEIADITAVVFTGTDATALPSTIIGYDGRELDNSWRQTASNSAGINRRSPLQIQIVDENGAPVQDAIVEIEPIDFDYDFGTAINYQFITGGGNSLTQDENSIRYRTIIENLFERVTDENQSQWAPFLADPTQAQSIASYANSVGLAFQAHAVLWGVIEGFPAPDFLLPEYEQRTTVSTEDARQWLLETILAHANQITTSLNGIDSDTNEPLVDRWDVINHPIRDQAIWDIVGEDAMLQILDATINNADQRTKLYFNEDQVISSKDKVLTQAYYELLSSFVNSGAQIDGIGFQSHFNSSSLPAIDSIISTLEQFESLGKELQSTEFDVDSTFIDSQTQADFSRDFTRSLHAQETSVGQTFWGFWEGSHWRADEGAAWVNENFSLTPAGIAILDAIAETRIQTNSLATNSEGLVSDLIPHGTYRITVTLPNGNFYDTTTSLIDRNPPPERLMFVVDTSFDPAVSFEALADQAVTLNLTEAKPNSTQLLVWGTEAGSTFLAAYGVTVDIANPTLASLLTIGETGAGQGTIPIPFQPLGQTYLFQAFDIEDPSSISDSLTLNIAGTPVIAIPNHQENLPPEVTHRLHDYATIPDVPFEFSIESDSFTDADSNDSLFYSAIQTDGSPLPGWLSFNPATLTFQSSDESTPGQLHIKIVATDFGVPTKFASSTFILDVLAQQNIWHNHAKPTDVNHNGQTTPIDALLILNRLNSQKDSRLPYLRREYEHLVDVNGDEKVTPVDAIRILNFLNQSKLAPLIAGSKTRLQRSQISVPASPPKPLHKADEDAIIITPLRTVQLTSMEKAPPNSSQGNVQLDLEKHPTHEEEPDDTRLIQGKICSVASKLR